MRRLSLSLLSLALIAAAVGMSSAPATASARTEGCRPRMSGPTCTIWTGKVTFVGDGDTLDVDVDGDGTKKPVHVRIAAIQAMEQSVYTRHVAQRRGECHALEATARLEQLVEEGHRVVRLAAQDPASLSRGRWYRSVAVKIRGKWQDVGRVLVSEGHALWMPSGVEYAWNWSYSVREQQAAAAGVGLWNPQYCGVGPEPAAALRMWVSWDAAGNDGRNPNGEWIKIKNVDPVNPVPLAGWWVRDSGLRRYVLPDWATVGPNQTITIYVGEGTSAGSELYWGLLSSAFDNASHDERAMGDGAYLFDPQGDMRLSMVYPCRVACVDPNQGSFRITVHPKGHESMTLQNVGPVPVDLEGYRLHTRWQSYDFDPDSVLGPGETMTLETGGTADDDVRLAKHWGEAWPILPNEGGYVKLSTYTDIDLACSSWGSGSC
jgi:endonuclease YncB( thermonuclease family)